MQIFKLGMGTVQTRGNAVQRIFDAGQIAPRICTQFYAVRHFTPQSEDILASKRFKIKLHRKTPIAAQRHGFVRYGVLAGA